MGQVRRGRRRAAHRARLGRLQAGRRGLGARGRRRRRPQSDQPRRPRSARVRRPAPQPGQPAPGRPGKPPAHRLRQQPVHAEREHRLVRLRQLRRTQDVGRRHVAPRRQYAHLPGRLPAAGRQQVERCVARHGPARRPGRLALGRERELRPQPLPAERRQHGQLRARRRQPDELLRGQTDPDAGSGQPGRRARHPRDVARRPADGRPRAEARYESYEIGAGEPNSYFGSGSQGFSGFRPENAGKNSRNNQSLYANFEADITKKLSGSFAVRHEHYSDFGDTSSAKASARYAFTPAFALRGTASNGFRAPSLAQQFYTITTTNFMIVGGENVAVETGTFPVGSRAALALGSQPLKPEKARNLSIGAQWQPTRNWTTTVDLYRIDIDDRIVFSSNVQLNGTSLRNALAAQGIFVGAARYFTNAVDTRTKGVDVVSTYRLNLQQGARADFTVAYNHNDNEVRHVAATPALLAAQGLVLADRQTVNRLTVGSPKDKLSLATDYTRGVWNGHATVTRYGKFTVPQNDPALDQTYDPQWVLDLSASVKLASNLRLTAGADNVTNRYPAQVTSAGNLNLNGINRYSGFAPNGFNGRFYYVKAAYAW
ncbi:TonB-dependent receptor [Telluria mixta]|uniref:TonB-dependent receptor domain-containing protein n=1 Tax=Telluria mixta TaxID=34071 RepID=UPI0024785015|nr:TonB-dependent receptor [Telluria mixta]WEM99417.1 TonB-dependent receptor [Telluria mixta]